MVVEDKENMAFIMPFGAFCYTTKTFGLKNTESIYQWFMKECLASQFGRNIQVYIDDVVVKSNRQDDLLTDLAETFSNM
jgi:hypothetical protein